MPTKSRIIRILDDARVKGEEKFGRHRRIGIAVLALLFVLLLWWQHSSQVKQDAAATEQFESERVLSQSAELVIGKRDAENHAALTIADYLKIVTRGIRIQHGFARYIPKKIATDAGESVALATPEIKFTLLDGEPFTQTSVDGKGDWWRLRLGSADTTLAPGEHAYQITTEIAGAPIYMASGQGAISIALIGPISAVVDHAQATIVLPEGISETQFTGSAWIGGLGEDFKLLSTYEEAPSVVSNWQGSSAGHPRVAVTFVAPRRLESMEGLWVSMRW